VLRRFKRRVLTAFIPSEPWLDRFVEQLLKIMADIPTTSEPVSQTPAARCRVITQVAAAKAAGIAGTLTLPSGPWAMVTIFPDLYAIWRVQARMVADVAAIYGKTPYLSREQMLYCLFRHAAGHTVRDLVVRVGERVLIKRASFDGLQQILRRLGFKLTQRLVGRTISRWLPVIGAAGMAAYAYSDTLRVGKTAIDLFRADIGMEGDPM
jgi:uncharacterized protein (DUF697 family)